MSEFSFTSESVSEGHPDKVCDQIADAILDAALKNDESARVACEVLASTGMIIIAGQITTTAYIDFPQIVRKVIKRIGYHNSEMGFDWSSCAILSSIETQSEDIARSVDKGGAGDQGIMFGYATNETKECMPFPIMLAHKIIKSVDELRHCEKKDTSLQLRPDGKTQVTVRYENNKPVSVDTIVLSVQHHSDVSQEELKQYLNQKVIQPILQSILPQSIKRDNVNVLINPTGRFVIGGPHGDCGLTGRKLMVDTYGGFSRHGGGSFSGKDPTKVDRSASYIARYIAKNLVASGICDRCELQLAYAIGVPEPVSLHLDTFGTAKRPENELVKLIQNNVDLTPQGIIKTLKLLTPMYEPTACYGHFGRPEFSWEKEDLKDVFA